MADLVATDLDMEQQAKFDKELAWCLRKLYSKLEHDNKSDAKKTNEIIKSINVLKNPAELLIKKRQIMFKMLGDYRAKIKAEESKKPLAKQGENKEAKNFKFIKKSSKNVPNEKNLTENLKNLNINKQDDNNSIKEESSTQKNHFVMASQKADFKFDFEINE